MEQEKQTKNRVSRIEEFLLDPEKTLFELLEEFGGSVEEIRNALSQIDVANLETLKGEDGKTPERGVDYFTDEDLDNIEAFILDRIPVVGEDVPSAKQVNEYIDKQVAKIPRVKGDKGNPGTPGKPGKDGSPDSAIDILKKIRSLDKNQGLQLNDIRGLSKKIALLNEVSDEFTQLKEDLSKIKILTGGSDGNGSSSITSVNGKTGTVVLTQDDIGDGTTYVRTENNFTDDLLSKLTGLQTSYSFLNLTDTPSAYTGQAGKFVKVNATNDGLEFASVGGGGDMLALVYDPKNVSGDAFDMDKMVEGTNNKLVSSAEKTAWNNKLDDITGESIADLSDVDSIAGITDGKVLKWNTNKFVVADDNDTTYTASDFDIKDLTDSTSLLAGKEDTTNKVTSFQTTPDNSHYPSEKLVKDSLDAKMSNPMTTAGDVIYGGLDGTPTRLSKGTAGQVLKMNSGATAPEWGEVGVGKRVYEDEDVEAESFGWDLSTASYDSVSFSVASQDTTPYGIAFKSDGSKMYMVGPTNRSVHQYTLSTPWDLSTASYDSVNFSVSSQDATPTGIAFKSDGSKMYMVGRSNDSVYQYTLSTPWDLLTASYDSVSFSVSSQDTNPYGITFKSDGSKMYVVGSDNDSVHQYTLSTPWDLSTASYDSVSFSVASQDTAPRDIAFKSDGSKMYVVGSDNKSVHQYTLSTPWDLSTASYDSVSFSVASQDTAPLCIAFKSDGSKMYMIGFTNKSVYQYTLESLTSQVEINCENYDEYYLTAMSSGDKYEISITGTPSNKQTIFLGLKDSGDPKPLEWTGITGLGQVLPRTTTGGKQHIIGLKNIGSAWRAIAISEEE